MIKVLEIIGLKCNSWNEIEKASFRFHSGWQNSKGEGASLAASLAAVEPATFRTGSNTFVFHHYQCFCLEAAMKGKKNLDLKKLISCANPDRLLCPLGLETLQYILDLLQCVKLMILWLHFHFQEMDEVTLRKVCSHPPHLSTTVSVQPDKLKSIIPRMSQDIPVLVHVNSFTLGMTSVTVPWMSRTVMSTVLVSVPTVQHPTKK